MTKEELEKLDQDLAKRQSEIKKELALISSSNPAMHGKPQMPNYDDDNRDEDAYVHEVGDMTTNAALQQQLENELEDIKSTRAKIKNGGNVAAAESLGQIIASEALKKGIKKVCFDRGGYVYHGRVKAFAEAARKAGMEF